MLHRLSILKSNIYLHNLHLQDVALTHEHAGKHPCLLKIVKIGHMHVTGETISQATCSLCWLTQ
jgi:hypothetical protein